MFRSRMADSSVVQVSAEPVDHVKNQAQSPLVKAFVAGAFSGIFSTVLFQPLDLVKTRLQKTANLGTNLGMFKEFSNVVRQEKFTGLWNGLWPSLYRCVPGIGLYFTSLHWMKTKFGSVKPGAIELIVTGASARTIAGMAVLPFTVMKTRYESGDFHYKSLSHGMRVTYTKEGMRGLFSGLTPTLLRDVPFSGLYLLFYTNLKRLSAETGSNPTYTNFTNGIFAGFLASLVTQPADVVKTNMQLYPKKYGRLKPVVLLIYNESGPIGFWRGIVPRTLRRTLMSAMSWTVYEEVMRAFHIKT